MEFTEIIKERYSCKKFDGKTVDRETLTKILEAGRLAPTAKNLQEQRIYIVESEEGLKAIDSVTPCRYNASTVLMVAFNKQCVFTYPGEKRTSGAEDASIVATHLMLAAKNYGVESCWINYFNPDTLAAAFKLPEEEEILMLLDLGYPAEGAGPLAGHFSRKDLSETVAYV